MFPHNSSSVCPLLPSRWGNGLKTSSPGFVLHLEILTAETATPLLWLFLVQRREEKGVARALSRAQLGAKLGFFFLGVLSFQKSLPCLLVCLLHISHSQPTIKQAIGEHSGSRDRVSCTEVESRVTLLVERALILKCAVNPTVGARQIHAYLPISTDGTDCILSLVNQLPLRAAIVLVDGLCPPPETCHSPPGLGNLNWTGASVSSWLRAVGFTWVVREEWRSPGPDSKMAERQVPHASLYTPPLALGS